jgi:hypothetical protein
LRSNIGTAPAQPHTPFHSQPLRRLLADWAGPAAAGSTGQDDDLAERLGRWLDWTDAVALSAALHQPPLAVEVPATGAPTIAQLTQALARLQADHTRLIGTDPVYLSGIGGALPGARAAGAIGATVGASPLDGPADADDATPYRRAAQARQRAMAAAIGPLRQRLRTALALASPTLARLAALDAALDTALAERERHLLDGVALRIGQRFASARAGAGADSAWRTRFHQDMQRLLLAELDLRLQPLHGLLAAWRQEQPA